MLQQLQLLQQLQQLLQQVQQLQQCHGIGVVGDDYEDSKVDSMPWQKILIFG